MSFLKNAIKKGISDAVSKAVEEGVNSVVKPKIAEAAANATDKVVGAVEEYTNTLDQATQELKQAGSEYNQTVNENQKTIETAAQNANMAGLGGLFGSLVSSATAFANEAAKNMKECPGCHEIVPADKEFCPFCGAKLPEKTIAESNTCPKCGQVNDIGTLYCSSCGEPLGEAVKQIEAFNREFEEKLPEYPLWTLGRGLSLNDVGEKHGYPIYKLYGAQIDQKTLIEYKKALLANGFEAVKGFEGKKYTKTVKNVTYGFDCENAFDGETFEGVLFEIDSYKEEEKSAVEDLLGDTAKDLKEGLNNAKEAAKAIAGLFKK